MICTKCIYITKCKDYSIYKDTIIACEDFKDANEENSALKKQIPKKPIIDAFNVYCPECDCAFGKARAKREAISNFKYFGYCSACGQALDWSDTE